MEKTYGKQKKIPDMMFEIPDMILEALKKWNILYNHLKYIENCTENLYDTGTRLPDQRCEIPLLRESFHEDTGQSKSLSITCLPWDWLYGREYSRYSHHNNQRESSGFP